MSALTDTYTALHEAFRATSVLVAGATAYTGRMLLAIHELGGSARTDQLADALACADGGSAVRREMLLLRSEQLVEAAAVTGGPPKPGTHTLLTLTDRGRGVVEALLERHRDILTFNALREGQPA